MVLSEGIGVCVLEEGKGKERNGVVRRPGDSSSR